MFLRLSDKGIIKATMKLTDIELGITMLMCFGTDTVKQQDSCYNHPLNTYQMGQLKNL